MSSYSFSAIPANQVTFWLFWAFLFGFAITFFRTFARSDNPMFWCAIGQMIGWACLAAASAIAGITWGSPDDSGYFTGRAHGIVTWAIIGCTGLCLVILCSLTEIRRQRELRALRVDRADY